MADIYRRRPRIELMGPSPPLPGEDLAIARERNDNLLKARFESIYEKYGHDFTGVGDEIGIRSGIIEVDNGHLRSLKNDSDIGTDTNFNTGFDGRRMLRAMTTAPSNEDVAYASFPGADDVIQSIETIADATIVYDESSDDDLFGRSGDLGRTASDDDTDDLSSECDAEAPPVDFLASKRSIVSQLLRRAASRSSSVDSLFEPEPNGDLGHKSPHSLLNLSGSMPVHIVPPRHSENDRTNLRQKDRSTLQEGNKYGQTHIEAKLETARRVPTQLAPSSVVAQPPHTRPGAQDIETMADSASMGGEKDTHALSTTKRRTTTDSSSHSPSRSSPPLDSRGRTRRIATTTRKRIRDESEDPLQEGFCCDAESSVYSRRHDPTTCADFKKSRACEQTTPDRQARSSNVAESLNVEFPLLSHRRRTSETGRDALNGNISAQSELSLLLATEIDSLKRER